MSTTSLLHTALQNLHVSQQMREQSHTPQQLSAPGSPNMRGKTLSSRGSSPPLSGDEDEDEMVMVGKGTAPGTPLPGQKGLMLGQRLPSSLGGGKGRDPLRTLPTHITVRIMLQLDIRALARCDRVCKRWHKSSTLNYVWFLQNRALALPQLSALAGNGKTRKVDEEIEFFDPYDKTPRLSALPQPPLPTSAAPQWSKAESKKVWKELFHKTLKRSDPNAPEEVDPMRITVESLHGSGTSTPRERHGYAGMGSGGAAKWENEGNDTGRMTPTEKKIAARENYKAMGGRKARGKRKMGGEMGARDRGGLVDDGRFDAPW